MFFLLFEVLQCVVNSPTYCCRDFRIRRLPLMLNKQHSILLFLLCLFANRLPVFSAVSNQNSGDQSDEESTRVETAETPIRSKTSVEVEQVLENYKNVAHGTEGTSRNADRSTLPLSKEQVQAMDYFEQAEILLNSTRGRNPYNLPVIRKAYGYLLKAAALNHTSAKELVAFAYLFGDFLTQNISAGRQLFEELSRIGSPIGQLGLGFMHVVGVGFDSSQAKGLIYLTFSALGGNQIARTILAYRYSNGIGVEQSCETALTYYRKVAKEVMKNLNDGAFNSGGFLVQRIRLAEEGEGTNNSPHNVIIEEDLLQYYQFLANKGDIGAQVGLGQLYYNGGRGVAVDHQLAYDYFLEAAKHGNANAMAFLGKMYAEGTDALQQDNATAYDYFNRAAELKNPIGQCGLGMMFLYGQGVQRDYKRALTLLTASAEQQWGEAQYQLGLVYLNGHGVRTEYRSAIRYFTLASQNGNLHAIYKLADMHADGKGVLRSCHTATDLLKSVAERGREWSILLVEAYHAFKSGQVNSALLKYMFLGEMGYEVAQSNSAFILDQKLSDLFTDDDSSYKRALVNWRRAASQGYAPARVKVGDYYYYGLGTKIDYSLAANHYRLATETQRSPQAMFNLGYMHEKGEGIKRDMHLAKRFYDLAAETSDEAQIPVALALAKLSVYFLTDWLSNVSPSRSVGELLDWTDPRYLLGPYWDYYLMATLAFVMAFIIMVRYRPLIGYLQPAAPQQVHVDGNNGNPARN